MKGGGRPVLVAFASLAFIAAGCQLVLDIPSDSAQLETSVAITCQCEVLLQQGAEFGEQCTSSVDALDDKGLVNAAERGCTKCTSSEIQACYALITSAQALGQACEASADCESWACCGSPRVEAGFQIGYDTQEDQPACSSSGCDTCQSALDAVELGQPMPAISSESAVLLEDMLACASDTKGGPMCTQPCTCNGDSPMACAAMCLRCMHDKPVCVSQRQACSSDPRRPIDTEGT